MAYFQIEPFGEERHDWRSGMIAATIANVNRPKTKAAYKPEDFMPEFDKSEQTWEEQWEAVSMWHTMLVSDNGK